MKPVEFPEQNLIIAKDQPEYMPLPAHLVRDQEGTVIFCWQLTLRERLQVLLTGKIWQQVLTFNQALQPQLLLTKKPFTKPHVSGAANDN